ncbi:FDLD family class I lanthipeptide [Brevibacillus formosus]|uniref:FDLD family class I lanthipeptide n=1 Tax=Brevibacillus formosus TaxID=54913 RepID=UPI003F1CCE8D
MKNDMFDLDVQVNTVSASGVKPDSFSYPISICACYPTRYFCTRYCKGPDER